MKTLFRLGALCVALAFPVASVLAQSPAAASTQTQNAASRQMQKLQKEYLDALWRAQPDTAIWAGKFDSAALQLIPDAAQRKRDLDFARNWLARFDKVEAAALSPAAQVDLALIQNQLHSEIWSLSESDEYHWNPSDYNLGWTLDKILNTPYAALEKRLRDLSQRLAKAPAYYHAARANLQNPTPEHTELAVQQSGGVQQVLEEISKQAKDAKLSAAEAKLLQSRLSAARAAVDEYALSLRVLLAKGEAKRSFRIGKEVYEKRFVRQIQSGLTGEETYQRALAAKEQMLTRMEKISDELWPKYMAGREKPAQREAKIGMLIDELSKQHSKPENFVNDVRTQLPELTRWVLEKNLLGSDASKPLQVRETPLYQRGVTTASIEAPGPFRPHDPTYYNVSPLTGLPPEQAKSWLREYNHWILQILNIHEAIPGHYTQLVYANKSPSLVKTLFGNGTMIEGWAVYGELMMMESGYGGNAPEMWLMYSKWNLRAICNTILDYSVHVLGMTREQALDLLQRQAFQSEAEALGKWRRVQLTSVQLASYFSGFSAIHALREERRKTLGERFDLKQFHEEFLSYGSAPVPMIARLMREKAVK